MVEVVLLACAMSVRGQRHCHPLSHCCCCCPGRQGWTRAAPGQTGSYLFSFSPVSLSPLQTAQEGYNCNRRSPTINQPRPVPFLSIYIHRPQARGSSQNTGLTLLREKGFPSPTSPLLCPNLCSLAPPTVHVRSQPHPLLKAVAIPKDVL